MRKAIGIKSEIVIAGVLNKIEIWPKEKYERDLQMFLEGKGENSALCKMTEEAFALLCEGEAKKEDPSLACLTEKEREEYQEV